MTTNTKRAKTLITFFIISKEGNDFNDARRPAVAPSVFADYDDNNNNNNIITHARQCMCVHSVIIYMRIRTRPNLTTAIVFANCYKRNFRRVIFVGDERPQESL